MRDQVYADLETSEEYRDGVKSQFQNCNFESFKMFAVDELTVESLKSLISYENLERLASDFELVRIFKDRLQLNEMSWMRADRIGEEE